MQTSFQFSLQTPPTPTGGSWSNQYGPHLNFTTGLPNPASAGAQQAWTFLKNQTPSAGTVQPGPGLASPNTPSPGPRQPFIFNLWPLGPGAQPQQSATGGQQTGLGTTANPGNPVFGATPGPPQSKYPVTSNASQIGAMPQAPPNIHNLVGLQQVSLLRFRILSIKIYKIFQLFMHLLLSVLGSNCIYHMFIR